MCRVLRVSASGYYAWRERPGSRRRGENRRLLAEIHTIHAKSTGTYGSLRVRAELRDRGHHCGRHRVARLMRTAGLQGIPKRRFRRTTTSGHTLPVSPNLLCQDFTATGPNQRWVADITYISTGEGWLYLAVILDLYSRQVVGWRTSAHFNATWFWRPSTWPYADALRVLTSFTTLIGVVSMPAMISRTF